MWWFILVIPGLGRWDRQSPGAGWPVNLALVSPRLMTDLSQSRWTVLLRMTTKNVLWFSCMPTHTGIHSLTHTNECHYGIPYMYVYDVLWPYLPSNNPVLWPCVPPRIPFLFESSPSSISFIPLFFKSRFLTSETCSFCLSESGSACSHVIPVRPELTSDSLFQRAWLSLIPSIFLWAAGLCPSLWLNKIPLWHVLSHSLALPQRICI